jgi:hypothetical protein
MLRSILAAMATATAASKVKDIARQAAYGAIAVFALLVALVFLSLAGFFWMSQSLGPAGAAAAVSGILAAFSLLVVAWVYFKEGKPTNEGWMEQLGVPHVAGITDAKDMQEMVDRAQHELRKIGPVKLSLAALAAGFVISRLR